MNVPRRFFSTSLIAILLVTGIAALTANFAAPDVVAANAPKTDRKGPAPLFSGLGKYSKPVSTRDPLAQRYFNQGMMFVWGFNHQEAIRSFTAAAARELAGSKAVVALENAYVPALKIAEIAARLAEGRAAVARRAMDEAVTAFKGAVELEDAMPYTEPAFWFYPTRHTLGAALLSAGRLAEAIEVFLQDLKNWPDNGWALHGLAVALEKTATPPKRPTPAPSSMRRGVTPTSNRASTCTDYVHAQSNPAHHGWVPQPYFTHADRIVSVCGPNKTLKRKHRRNDMNTPLINHNGRLAPTNRKQSVISSLLLLGALLGLPVSAQAAVYNFQLDGPNTAADADGNVIAVTGTGRFDTTAGTVSAGGAFTVYNSEGTVVSKGTWAASSFVDFDSYGGVNRGYQTGRLEMVVTLTTRHGSPVSGGLMVVYCEPGEVPGAAEANSEDGITLGEFTESTGGYTLFQRIGPSK